MCITIHYVNFFMVYDGTLVLDVTFVTFGTVRRGLCLVLVPTHGHQPFFTVPNVIANLSIAVHQSLYCSVVAQ